MKRKSSSDNNESKITQLLFNKSKDLIDKLEHKVKPDIDYDKKPVWVDEDDEHYNATNSKKNHYTAKLKRKYENLVGTPAWAKLDYKNINTEDQDDEILRTVGHIKKNKTLELRKDFLAIKNMGHINTETKNEGKFISCIEFHPKLSVSLVGGNTGIVSLFSIGDESKKIHSFKLSNWKITTAQFTSSGSEAFLSSNTNNNYCVYDLIKAQPKLTPLPHFIKRPKLFQLSLDGKLIATSGGLDEIFLFDTASKELVRSLKHNSNVQSLTFSNDSTQLYSYTVEGQVMVWDLSTFKVLKKFYDNGCVNASCITSSSCGRLLATGSCEGIINIYETSKLTTMEPIPLNTVTNLTTKISNLKFNATTEILAASSAILPNALKLIHIPSYNVFTNFPDKSVYLSHIETVNFSPNSGYMAVGNDRGCANLYRLKYYKNY